MNKSDRRRWRLFSLIVLASVGFVPGILFAQQTPLEQAQAIKAALADVQLQVDALIQALTPPPPPINVAPTVDAGPDQIITLPSTAALAGSVSDDGLPNNTLVAAWGPVSGVSYVNPANVTTSATFAQAGTYALTLTASDSVLTTTDTVTITVNPAPPPPPSSLIQPTNLVYQGAFKVPLIGSTDDTSFAYSSGAIAFNPANQSLFVGGKKDPAPPQTGKIAEISIPSTLGTGSVSSLPRATLLQPLSDPTDGRMSQLNPSDPNAKYLGDGIVYQSKLYQPAWSYYDGAGSQILSHFVSGLNLSVTNDATGPWQVGGQVQGRNPAGFVSGYMAIVPLAHRGSLGGPAVTGQCCIGILSRTSSGPALFSVDPMQLGQQVPLPAAPLVYYDLNHQTLGGQYSNNTLFNGDAEVRGVVVPDGWRSVLFFGRLAPNYCYGVGTPNQSLAGQQVPGQPTGVIYCYDPEGDTSKGSHSYPRSFYVWAYDVNDLAAVKAGTRTPWSVVPYASWGFTLPYPNAGPKEIIGAGYDATTSRIFLAQGRADGNLPIIHVFKVQP